MLRHNPDAAGIALDPSGWAKASELLEAARLAGMHLDREALKVIVDTDPKKRYAMSADGTLIRANYGHSVPVDLGLDALEPPEYLFHGTSEPNLNAIRAGGLQPRKRQFVHLSRDAPAAAIIGRRHGRPVVLSVRALEMHAGGAGWKHVTREDAANLLKVAKSNRLATRPFRDYESRQRTEGICFCCDDCCEYFLNPEEICEKGRLIEKTAVGDCIDCGACAEVCYFKAREMDADKLVVDREKCFGCGLCRDVCPVDCIEMVSRHG